MSEVEGGARQLIRYAFLASRMKGHDLAFRRDAARPTPDWDTLFTHHDRFHRELQDASAGPHTHALLGILRPQIDRCEWCFAPMTGDVRPLTGRLRLTQARTTAPRLTGARADQDVNGTNGTCGRPQV